MARNTTYTSDITVRLADYSDNVALARLAALDSKRLPDGRLVIAERDGQMLAAMPLAGGPALADPFHRTAALVEMLELRARQLRDARAASRHGLAGRLKAIARLQPQLP